MQEEFQRALTQLWARDGIVVGEPGVLAGLIASSFVDGKQGTRAAATLLSQSGVRAQWNDILRRDRSRALASQILPHITEPLLDVLSGDGSVCRALADLGVASLAATERPTQYTESVLPPHAAFEPFTDGIDLSLFGASTALMSAVLHHEKDPVALLDALATASIPRWVVVENCVTAQFSRHFHQLADRFFNTCLNEFGVDCVEQHRTLDEWVDLLKSYGSVTVISDAFTVPGIPFPYSLLSVNRSA